MIEKELKFKILKKDINKFKALIKEFGGALIMQRSLEETTMYDNPSGVLKAEDARLRLRGGAVNSISYKRVLSREKIKQEIEFESEVENLLELEKILNECGFSKKSGYQRYRTIWKIGEVKIFLDEFSFGSYVEIEGKAKEITKMAGKLNFNIEENLTGSYDGIYKDICKIKKIKPQTFFK